MKPPALVLILATTVSGCASSGAVTPAVPNALGLQQIETRRLDTTDARLALRAVVRGLQDAGFTVERGDVDLGLVVARRAHIVSDGPGTGAKVAAAIFFWPALFAMSGSTTAQIELSVSVTADQATTRVRLTGSVRHIGGRGEVKSVRRLVDPVVLQDLFARIDKALFLERQAL